MSLLGTAQTLNQEIWMVIEEVSIDSKEKKQLIDCILKFSRIARKTCKNEEHYKKLVEKTFKDLIPETEQSYEYDLIIKGVI